MQQKSTFIRIPFSPLFKSSVLFLNLNGRRPSWLSQSAGWPPEVKMRFCPLPHSPPSPLFFFLLHLATVSCIDNKPLSGPSLLGPGQVEAGFYFQGGEGAGWQQPGFAVVFLPAEELPLGLAAAAALLRAASWGAER